MELKRCPQCETLKEPVEFNKKKSTKDGLSVYCKVCKRENDRISYLKNKEKKLERAKAYYEQNKATILEKIKTEQFKQKRRSNYSKNKEHYQQYKKDYRLKNKERVKELAKKYKRKRRELGKDKEYIKKRYENNPVLKVIKNLRKGVHRVLQSKGAHKIDSYTQSIGTDPETLKSHIEKQFEPGMTWDNYGLYWNIDHKIPLSNGYSIEKIYELNHYTNLKPMKCSENFSKGTNPSECWQYLRRKQTIEEDIRHGFPTNLKVNDFLLNKEEYTIEHKRFIERYEWLGNIGYGIPEYIFTARWNGKLAGIVMLNYPNTSQFGELEIQIQRGACSSWAPKNLNSKLVMFACRWMVNNTKYRIFTAYSDFEAGEIGTIYQACNFDYLGQEYGARYKYINKEGKEINERYFNRTSTWKKYARNLGIEWNPEWSTDTGYKKLDMIPEEIKNIIKEQMKVDKSVLDVVPIKPKGKYVLLLKRNKRENIIKTWEPKPYPKRFNN